MRAVRGSSKCIGYPTSVAVATLLWDNCHTVWDNRHAVMRQLSHNADSNLPLANPLRSLCALCGFAREEQLPRDIFSRQGRKDLMTVLTP